MAQLARFYHWSPDILDGLTGERLIWWTDQANAMLMREAEARRVS